MNPQKINKPADEQMESYLANLRKALARLPEEDRKEIVRETRSHFLDRLELNPEASFLDLSQGLGSVDAYAQSFLDNYELNRALASGSTFRMIRAAGRHIRRGFSAFFGFLIFLVLYSTSFALAAVAILKPIFPQQVGFWTNDDPVLFTIGFIPNPPPTATEHMGYWIIPFSLTVAMLIFLATKILLKKFLVWLRGPSRS